MMKKRNRKAMSTRRRYERRRRPRPDVTADVGHYHVLESLETRLLMTVTLTDNIDDQNINTTDPALVLDLNDHFTDDAISERFLRFDSVLGGFFVELFPAIVPNTVANFLNYVNDGRLNDSIIHRSIPGFVAQGGGFTYFSETDGVEAVPTDPPILNEFDNWYDPAFGGLDTDDPVNTRGTISMALTADPDSGTSGFFFNDVDNVAGHPPGGNDLDAAKHTVFGEAVTLTVLDAILDLNTMNFGSPFTNFPLLDDSADPLAVKSNVVLFSNIETSDLQFEVISNDNTDIVTVDINADGTLTMTPTGIGSGTATILIRGTDLDDTTTIDDAFTLTLDGPPGAHDDLQLTDNNIDPILVAVLANDSGASAIDPTTVVILDQPDFGDVVVDATTGGVTYTPRPEFLEIDAFTYTVMDVDGRTSNEATATVAVKTAPIAADDSFESTDINATIEIDVLANDTDFNGNETIDATTITIISPPTIGNTTIDPVTGVVTYTFNAGVGGDDSFTYTVDDDSGQTSNTATVNISVQTDPAAEDDEVSVDIPSGPIPISVLDNDTDDNGDTTIDVTTVTIISDPSNGTIVVDPVTGVVTYTPDDDMAANGGNDTFTYTVTDTTGRVSTPAVVTIAVQAPPVANTDDVTRTVSDVAGEIAFSVLFNDTDANGLTTIDATTLSIMTDPTAGTLEVDPDTGFVTYTPETGFTGTDTFTYTVDDDTGRVSNVATVTLDILAIPVAGDDDVIVALDLSPVTFDVLANDTDGNGNNTIDRTTLTIIDAVAGGSITIDPGTQIITYTPDPDFDGGDSFTYQVTDQTGLTSNLATVALGFPVGTSFGDFFHGTNLTTTINGVDVTFMLIGAGSGTVVASGGEQIDINITGTDTTSRHVITTRGGSNRFLVNDITADSSMASITGRTTDLSGDITIPGIVGSIQLADVSGNHVIDILGNTTGAFVRLVFANVTDLVINTGIAIQSLVVNSWVDTDDEQDEINAPSIISLQSRGAFQANLNLDRSNGAATTLSIARITGTISNVTWTIAGNVGAVLASDLNNFTLNVNRDAGFGGTVRFLRLGRLFGTNDLTVDGSIFTILATNWSSGTIRAEQVRTILIIGVRGNRQLGDFAADLDLQGGTVVGPRLFRIYVADTIHNSTWDVDGTIGSIFAITWHRGELNAMAVHSIQIQRDFRNNAGGTMQVDMTLQGGNPARRLGVLRVARQVQASTWVIDGPVGVMLLDRINRLTLDLNAALPMLRAGQISDSDLDVAGRISTIVATAWDGGSLTASSLGWIRMLGSRQSLGNFNADVTLTGDNHRFILGGTLIRGVVSGGDWDINGDAGQFRAYSWDAGSFTAASLQAILLRPAPSFKRIFGIVGDLGIDLTLTGATHAFARLSAVIMNGTIREGRWQIDGDVIRISTANTNLAWSANVSGRVRDLRILGDAAGTLAAASFGMVTITGELNRATLLAGANLGADATLGGIGVDADTFGPGSIDRIAIGQRVRTSTIGAGLDPVNGLFNDGDDVVLGGAASFIGSLAIRGPLDTLTLIGAGQYPPRVILEGVPQVPSTVDNLL